MHLPQRRPRGTVKPVSLHLRSPAQKQRKMPSQKPPADPGPPNLSPPQVLSENTRLVQALYKD